MIYLTGGIVTIEYLFAYPGLGSALAAGVQSRDLPVVQAIVLLFAASYVLFNLLADVLTIAASPPAADEVPPVSSVALPAARRRLRSPASRARPALRPHAHRHRCVTALVVHRRRWSARSSPRTIRRRSPASRCRRPRRDFPLGTDYLGHDVLSRLLWGGRSVVWMAFAAATLGVAVGAGVGMLAGFCRSRLDDSLMRLMDVILAFPQIVLVLLFVSMLGSNLALIVGLVALAWVPQVARVARGVTADVVHREYVQAAEAIGLPRRRILLREMLPERRDAADGRVRPAPHVVDRGDRRDQLPRLRDPAAERRLGPDDQREPQRHHAPAVGGRRARGLHRGVRDRHELRHRGHLARGRARRRRRRA